MIVELRIYDIKTGHLREFLKDYASDGLPIQTKHLGKPLGYYSTEIGDVNQVVHLWRYDDFSDRERRRQALESDKDWIEYKKKALAAGQVIGQKNSILREINFSDFL